MRLTIFGASGGTGRELVRQAVDAGHMVTAVVRDAATLAGSAADVRSADVLDPIAIQPSVKDADAVLSALGPRRKGLTTICSQGIESITTAARATGVRRIVAISAAPVSEKDPGDGLLYRTMVRPILVTALRSAYVDMAEMERRLRESGQDWTVVRPPRLTDKRATGHYRTARDRNLRGGRSISRADLAHAMLAALDDDTTIGHTIGIAY